MTVHIWTQFISVDAIVGGADNILGVVQSPLRSRIFVFQRSSTTAGGLDVSLEDAATRCQG